MTMKTQLSIHRSVPAALVGAALTLACGRSEIAEPVDPSSDVALSITVGQLGPDTFVNIPNLAQYRLDHWQQIRGTLPPLNAIQPEQQAPSGQLLRWNRSVLQFRQLQGMPLVYHEAREGEPTQRYMIYLDRGKLYVSAVWEAHDKRWVYMPEDSMTIDTHNRAEPLSMWSDMYGALEMRSCRMNDEGRFDCELDELQEVNAYFPRSFAKGQGPKSLSCLSNCINPAGDDVEPFFDNAPDPESAILADVLVSYDYDTDAQMLRYEGADVMPEVGRNLSVVGGFMFDTNDKYLNNMACSLESGQPVGICDHAELAVFYTWSTDSRLPAFGRRPVR